MSIVETSDGLRATPEALAEWESLIGGPENFASMAPDCVQDAPEPRRRHNRRRPNGTRQAQSGDAMAASGNPQSSDERRIAEFERKVIPWGRHAGKRWGDVPLSFVQWFADLDSPRARGAAALQVQVREYLRLKYGLESGRLF